MHNLDLLSGIPWRWQAGVQMCSGWVARRRRSTLLVIISIIISIIIYYYLLFRLNPTEGASVTTHWSPHQASHVSVHQDSRFSSVGQDLSWGSEDWLYGYLWTGQGATGVLKQQTVSSHLCHLTCPPRHSQGCQCQHTKCSVTKHLHSKDPANFLFPWPRGDRETARLIMSDVMKARHLWEHSNMHLQLTAMHLRVKDGNEYTDRISVARSFFLTVFV